MAARAGDTTGQESCAPPARISFTVLGVPAPQGSKRHVGRGILVESSKAALPWRQEVAGKALEARQGAAKILGPVNVDLTFTMPRPKAHYRANGDLKPTAPTFCPKKPDIDKLTRTVLDALTIAQVIHDDGQVATLHARKAYVTADHHAGVDVVVQQLLEEA